MISKNEALLRMVETPQTTASQVPSQNELRPMGWKCGHGLLTVWAKMFRKAVPGKGGFEGRITGDTANMSPCEGDCWRQWAACAGCSRLLGTYLPFNLSLTSLFRKPFPPSPPPPLPILACSFPFSLTPFAPLPFRKYISRKNILHNPITQR